MRVAIMQPYVFPYIGYFQLLNAVDKFVFYDDVNFIKGGWINRNKILINGKENLFTIPLDNSSQNKFINQTTVQTSEFRKWKKKFLRGISQAYAKAPFFSEIFPIIEKILVEDEKICTIAVRGIKEIIEYLGLKKEIFISSEDFPETQFLNRSDRIIGICKKLGAGTYINMSGGKELYKKEYFEEKKIQLLFLDPKVMKYKQGNNDFVSGLSIIDVLMFNSAEDVLNQLDNYNLI